ncbi:M6 family metalloprotease domain-containing protein [Janthinobacterium sp. PC23-8]|uniref:M6 family metalloprotease domain-containing protein n=1 Tax=Janthinobacterium sp. PC23-8 TaxID=2012679 RepID=UPI000B97B16A|nr:M6 family metalloprotease domain-containing protein [Janthinobacterium sp. PC23-8]OYO29084.1 hypothetical protein CD932_18390 [Janthinobacterium sp. PC23-8]
MCTPFNAEEFTFVQPDGSNLTVRGWGNQYHATFEALNGYTVVENPATGFYMYAKLSDDGEQLLSSGARPREVAVESLKLERGLRMASHAARAQVREGTALKPGTSRWEQRRKQYKNDLRAHLQAPELTPAPPKRETVGDFVGLCLLIDFPDVRGTISKEEVEKFCNQPGYEGFGNHGSVHDYFLDVSGGRMRYTNLVTPWYTARQPRSYYTNERVAQPIRARELIKEALDHFKRNGFDFSSLTTDDQEYVYASNVFYAGKRVNNWAKGLWPHAYHLLTPYKLADGMHSFDYQITDMDRELALGTFCHENGHMICDFPDLYDYGAESSGIGDFCLMCSGSNVDKKNPTQVNAYLKYRAGWASSTASIRPGNATAEANANQFYIHRNSANKAEYFIIENRQASSRDHALPSQGLAIWHIDEKGDNRFEQMSAQQHYECSLMQADGKCDLERDSSNRGDMGDLFPGEGNTRFGPGTAPASRWWDGSPSGLDLDQISAAGASISFSAR